MRNISLLIIILFAFGLSAQAKVIQILHTNDTHSFLEHSTYKKNTGGMARLKALIDQYKFEASDENISTVVLDAGDFLEGNLFYLADGGKKSFQIHNEIGYDVGALGNHDYLMGSEKLDSLLSEIDLKYSFVAANLYVNKKYQHLKSKIKPYAELNIDGVKIGVLGLTTDEIFYRWSLNDCEITDPVKVAQFYEDELRNRGNEFIIALTHIGVLNDIKLVEKSSKIDLVVGGHNHLALFQPVFAKNKNGKNIPIVQAGMHTEYLGRILVDIVKGQPVKILKYELIPVTNEAKDEAINNSVEEAKKNLENAFGEKILHEILGVSTLNPEDKDGMNKWGTFIAETMKEESSADISIHSPAMNSENFPRGNFTRLDLYNSIPRIFNPKDTTGWTIFTADVKGIWIRSLLAIQARLNEQLVFSGVTKNADGKLMINGKKIDPLKSYKVAFTEGIIRGAAGLSTKTFAILRNPTETKLKIWLALERKIAREILMHAKDDSGTNREVNNQSMGIKILRPFHRNDE